MTSKLKKKLDSQQVQALDDIERLVGKDIPQIKDYVTSGRFGAKIEGNNIVELGLNDCYLSTLPESIGNLTFLRKLYLEFNQLTTLPDSIANLQSLQLISLNNNKFINFPESITSLQSIQEIQIWNNELTNIPESIGKIKSLQVLDLYGNKLITLPDSIGNLSSLRQLDLWDNKLANFSEGISNIKTLQILNVSSNELISLPDSISNLQSLNELKLNDNKLITLPESFSQLQELRDLQLENNMWKGEWADIAKKDIPTILKLCRKLNGIRIFISHAWDDQQKYQIMMLKIRLKKECLKQENKIEMNIIHEVYICETDVLDDIWDFMSENVPKSHLLLFIATPNSIASEACRYELFLANKFDIEILPIKGNDIKWEDLSRIQMIDQKIEHNGTLDLSRPKEKFEFDEKNFNEIFKKLSGYILTHEYELKKDKKWIEGLGNTKKNILDIINSRNFRDIVKDNFEELNRLYQELIDGYITNFQYYWKLGEYLK
ncbi:MAG: hypothetical protein JXA99_15185 [Candidatus Lokiarchaeota archaeon]|nr:hypothetical protein [Candidatus Lokiarchaeota archaeon]